MLIWYIFPVLVFCTKKNLATLDWQPTKFHSFSDNEQISNLEIKRSNP
jgi:hypothetical protein